MGPASATPISELPFELFLVISSHLPLAFDLTFAGTHLPSPLWGCGSISSVQCCTSRGWGASITNVEYVDCESSTYERRGYPKETESFSEPLHPPLVYQHFNKNTDPYVRSFHQCTPETYRCGWATASLRFDSSHRSRMGLDTTYPPHTSFAIPGGKSEEMPQFKKCFFDKFHTGIWEQVDRAWSLLHQGI